MLNSDNISELNQFKNNYEEFIRSLQAEVDFYKKEHELMRNEITKLTSKRQLSSGGNGLLSTDLGQPDIDLINHKKLTDDSINNLKDQLKVLNDERDTLHKLWKTSEKTCANLEIELSEYKRLWKQPDSMCQLRQEFEAATKIHEVEKNKLKNELSQQKQINTKLLEAKAYVAQTLVAVEGRYINFLAEQSSEMNKVQRTESTLNAAKSHIVEIMRQRNDFEKRFVRSNNQLQEHKERETAALNKIQEVLQLAEVAIAEKDAALQREESIKEECDHLATTIGHVLEEAATKCDLEMEERQSQYSDKIKKLENVISKMKVSYDVQSKRASIAEMRAQVLENKLKSILQTNVTLDAELQIASKTIVEMEIKLQAFEKLMHHEKEANKISEERSEELKEFLAQNKKLKQRWKVTVDEMASKLQAELKQLHNENASLKKENHKLHSKLQYHTS